MIKAVLISSTLLQLGLLSCFQRETPGKSPFMQSAYTLTGNTAAKLDTITFGSGCFWCTEAIFSELKGVQKVTSGYSGGHVKNPTYEEVCGKKTGHAEVVQIIFDPQLISFDELLEVFFQVHDPTTLNKQGADEGPQYRSAIFYHSEEQKEKAVFYKNELDKSGAYDNKIVTEISAWKNFYSAEDYHQKFYANKRSLLYDS